MSKDISKDLFSKGSFYITADSTPWTSEWADRLVDFCENSNLANNINHMEFFDDINICVEDGEISVFFTGEGDDGEYQKYIYLSATVGGDFSLDNFDYNIETGDAVEFNDEEEEDDDDEEEDDEDEEEDDEDEEEDDEDEEEDE